MSLLQDRHAAKDSLAQVLHRVTMQVSVLSTVLRDLRVALHVRLMKLKASLSIGSKIDKGKNQFAKVSDTRQYHQSEMLRRILHGLTPGAQLSLLRLLQEAGSYIYVYIVGTLPEHQNKGLGSALLSHINAIADSRRLPCYLEVSLPLTWRFSTAPRLLHICRNIASV